MKNTIKVKVTSDFWLNRQKKIKKEMRILCRIIIKDQIQSVQQAQPGS